MDRTIEPEIMDVELAKKLLMECNITEEQANAIAQLTLILEKNKTCRESSLI